MALHTIIGNAGSGKTYALYQQILCLSGSGRQLVLLVPEQATLTAQKELTAMHPEHCILYCDILSFRRLGFRLTEELGDRLPAVLEDTGKGMLLKKLLLEHRDELKLYAGKERRKGFVGEVRSMVSEFSQYCVQPEDFAQMQETLDDPLLSHKLSDLQRIYELFLKEMDGNYLTEADLLAAMGKLVEQSQRLRGSVLFLDGYTGFTPAQYQLLTQLFSVAADVYVTVTMDPSELLGGRKAEPLFTMSRDTKCRLERIAERCGHRIERPICVDYENRPEGLRQLSCRIFRTPAGRSDVLPPITIRSLATRREEIRYLVTQVSRYVREEGYRYRDIGILCGDVQGYSEDLQKAFRRAGIPCFIDYKDNVLGNPCVDLIRSALRVIATDFRREAVVHYMKNPLSLFTHEEASRMENYLLATGVRGSGAWEKGFVRRYSDRQAMIAEDMDVLRVRMMETFDPLLKGFQKESTVRDGLMAIYELLISLRVPERMEEWADELLAMPELTGAVRREKEYRQIFAAVIHLMEQTEEILGDRVLACKEFADILDAGFEETMLGIIPPKPDEISIGDVKRSRLQQVKVLFFLGVNEGVVPGFSHAGGLLSDREREKLKEQGMELAETAKEAVNTEEFYLYLALSKPAAHLYLLFRRCGDDGKELRPSYVIHRILRIFPKLSIAYGEDADYASKLFADGGERLLLSEIVREHKGAFTPDGRAVRDFYAERGGRLFESRLTMEQLKEAAKGVSCDFSLSEEAALALYTQMLYGSVSRMESFAKCAYQHFLRYGLRLSERKEFKISNLDEGNLLHQALCAFFEGVKKDGLSFRRMTKEEAEPRIRQAVTEAVEKQTTDLFGENRRSRYQLKKLERLLQRTIDTTCRQLRDGSFEPELFEHKINHTDERLNLVGTIDRVDICVEDGVTYFKVVDYKLGERKIRWSEVLDGTSVQLPVYLSKAAELFGGESAAAAALYYSMKDPYVPKNSDVTAELRKRLRPEGFAVENRKALHLLDHDLVDRDGAYQPSYTSMALPVATVKDCVPTKNSKLISDAERQTVFDYLDWMFHEETERIVKGEIAPHPYGGNTTCDGCPYHSVCGFDSKASGCTGREATVADRSESIERMRRKMQQAAEENENAE